MPATQWVVKQLGCDNRTAPQDNETPRVSITNREFANVAFTGQLYNVKKMLKVMLLPVNITLSIIQKMLM